MLKNFRINRNQKNYNNSSNASSEDIYVGKRIKQNLHNIDFDDDSDEDTEWSRQSKNAQQDDLLSSSSKKILP